MRQFSKPLLLSLLIFPLAVSAQKSELYIDSNSGSCTRSIKLNDNGVYTFESKCPGIYNTSFGTWVQIKDTIRCTQIETKDFKIVSISPSTIENSKTVSVKIVDQTGQNITEKIRVKQYVPGKGYFNMELDSTQTNRTDSIRDSATIVVEPFDRLLNGIIGMPVASFTNFDIVINVPNDLVYNITSDWINIERFEFLKTNDALISVKTYPSDGNKKPFRIKYKKRN